MQFVIMFFRLIILLSLVEIFTIILDMFSILWISLHNLSFGLVELPPIPFCSRDFQKNFAITPVNNNKQPLINGIGYRAKYFGLHDRTTQLLCPKRGHVSPKQRNRICCQVQNPITRSDFKWGLLVVTFILTFIRSLETHTVWLFV